MSDYFKPFDNIVYANKKIVDITKRADIIPQLKNTVALYFYYIVEDDNRPEDVAFKVYGDENLYWIILMINDVINPYTDWIMSDSNLTKYCQEKYSDIDAVHHYKDVDGNWANEGTSVSNIEYERELNNSKRRIKLIRPEYISTVVSQLEKLL